MTHQNKAREALALAICNEWETLVEQYPKTIRHALTLLERLEGVDRVALREALKAEELYQESKCENATSLWEFHAKHKKYPHKVVTEAARIVADMGE